jgi:hypothetical protein
MMVVTRYTYIVFCEMRDHDDKLFFKRNIKVRGSTSILRALYVMANRSETKYWEYKTCTIKSNNVFKEIILPTGLYHQHKNDDNYTFRALGTVGPSESFTITFIKS